MSAQLEYARGDLGRTRLHAERALALAASVDRPLEIGRAHAVLACAAARAGTREQAVAHIGAARETGSNQLSAGAAAWLRDAENVSAPRPG